MNLVTMWICSFEYVLHGRMLSRICVGYQRYALSSILHYDEVVNQHRKDPNKYEWEGKLDFENLDLDNINVRDVHEIEQLSNWKINVHEWGDRGLAIRCNDKICCHYGNREYFVALLSGLTAFLRHCH